MGRSIIKKTGREGSGKSTEGKVNRVESVKRCAWGRYMCGGREREKGEEGREQSGRCRTWQDMLGGDVIQKCEVWGRDAT